MPAILSSSRGALPDRWINPVMHNVGMNTVPGAQARDKRQAEVVAALTGVLPGGAILFRHEDTVPYECDALTAYRTSPLAVVLPETETQVAAALKTCHRMGVPIIARGERVIPDDAK